MSKMDSFRDRGLDRLQITVGILNILTIGVAWTDYALWRSSPAILGNISGILITSMFIVDSVMTGICAICFSEKGGWNILAKCVMNFMLILSVATLIFMFLSATGQMWCFYAIMGYLFLQALLWCALSAPFRERIISRMSERGKAVLKNLIHTAEQSDSQLFFRILRRIIIIIAKIIMIALFLIAVLLAHALLTGGDNVTGQITGAAASMAAGHIILMLPILFIFLLELFPNLRKRTNVAFLIVPILILPGIFSLPILTRSLMIQRANEQFLEQFGSGWDEMPDNTQGPTLKERHIASQFYWGYSWDRAVSEDQILYNLMENQKYKQGDGFSLYYDARYPKSGYRGLDSIGKNSTVIMLHGGGWNSGDKGEAGHIQNHLAGQGYVVFDVQYRLLDSQYMNSTAEYGIANLFQPAQPREYQEVYGPYSILDMMEDIGDFTHYLASLSPEERFFADLNSTVMIGVSAGGYLAALTSYGYNNTFFNGYFNSSLRIKATALYNPPNDAQYFFYDRHPMYYPYLVNCSPTSCPALYYNLTPSNFIGPDSPPTILFHGLIDKMVPPINSRTLYDSLKAQSRPTILINSRFGGHGFDFAPYNSPTVMYYLERFLNQIIAENNANQ